MRTLDSALAKLSFIFSFCSVHKNTIIRPTEKSLCFVATIPKTALPLLFYIRKEK